MWKRLAAAQGCHVAQRRINRVQPSRAESCDVQPSVEAAGAGVTIGRPQKRRAAPVAERWGCRASACAEQGGTRGRSGVWRSGLRYKTCQPSRLLRPQPAGQGYICHASGGQSSRGLGLRLEATPIHHRPPLKPPRLRPRSIIISSWPLQAAQGRARQGRAAGG